MQFTFVNLYKCELGCAFKISGVASGLLSLLQKVTVSRDFCKRFIIYR